MAIIVYPPHYPYEHKSSCVSMFLAGSIEMGKAELWQDRIIECLQDQPVLIYNPRRKDWDTSWKQAPEDKNFSNQVNWELDHLEKADIKVFYFDPNTISPITFMELGMMLASSKDKCIVCCPDGFWRKGNIQITCGRHGVVVLSTLDELCSVLKKKVEVGK